MIGAAAILVLGQAQALVQPEGIGKFVVGDRVDVRMFSIPQRHPELDVGDTVISSLTLSAGSFTSSFSYLPSLVYADITTPEARGWVLQHVGRARLSYSIIPVRRLTLSAFADGSYTATNATVLSNSVNNATLAGTGTQNGTNGTGTIGQTPGAQAFGFGLALPPGTTLKVANVRGGLLAVEQLTRRWVLTGSVTELWTRGIGQYSRILSPPTSTLTMATSASYALTRQDALSTRLTANRTDFTVVTPSQPDSTTTSWIVSISEGYTHVWSSRTSGTISAGIGASTSTTTGDPGSQTGLSAFGDGIFLHLIPLAPNTSLSFRALAQYGLAPNPFDGTVQQQVAGSLTTTLTKSRFTAYATLSGTTTLDVTPPTRSLAATAVASYSPVNGLEFFTGASLSEQYFPQATLNALEAVNQPITNNGAPQWTVFAGVAVTAPAIRF